MCKQEEADALNREARVGEEDRSFREDPSMVDIATTISGPGRKQSRMNLKRVKMTTRNPFLVCRYGYHV